MLIVVRVTGPGARRLGPARAEGGLGATLVSTELGALGPRYQGDGQGASAVSTTRSWLRGSDPPQHLPSLSSSAPLPRSGPRAPSPDRLRGGRADGGGAQGAQGPCRSGGGPLLHPLVGPGSRTLFASAVNGLAPVLGSETPQGSPDRPALVSLRSEGAAPTEGARPPGLRRRCVRARRVAAPPAFPRAPAPDCARPEPARAPRHCGGYQDAGPAQPIAPACRRALQGHPMREQINHLKHPMDGAPQRERRDFDRESGGRSRPINNKRRWEGGREAVR